MFASMQAMMEEMQAAHSRQMQELQAQMQHLQQQVTGEQSAEMPSSTNRSKDAIKQEATRAADQ